MTDKQSFCRVLEKTIEKSSDISEDLHRLSIVVPDVTESDKSLIIRDMLEDMEMLEEGNQKVLKTIKSVVCD